jgi:hypothetical protein
LLAILEVCALAVFPFLRAACRAAKYHRRKQVELCRSISNSNGSSFESLQPTAIVAQELVSINIIAWTIDSQYIK